MKPQSSSWRALFLLWLAGNGLRLSILAVPPVLALIQADLDLTGTQVGILTGLPVILFAVAAVPGALLIARVGSVRALVIGLLIAAAGSALRGTVSDTIGLYVTTIVMSAGIAFMQPALPPTVRQWVPHRIGFGTAVYTNGLLVGEIAAVALTIPLILPLAGGSWRMSLILWSVPSAVIAVMILFLQPKVKEQVVVVHKRWMPDWRDPLLWKVAIMLGAGNTTYFCCNGFLPGYLTSAGHPELIGPALTALNVGQLPASILLLAIASRIELRVWPFVVSGILMLIGIVGMVMTASYWTVAGAALLGFAAAAVLALGLALPPLLAAPDDVPRMSAGIFTISYGMSMAFSVIAGICWDYAGAASFAFLPIAIAALPLIFVSPLVDFARRRSETVC